MRAINPAQHKIFTEQVLIDALIVYMADKEAAEFDAIRRDVVGFSLLDDGRVQQAVTDSGFDLEV